MITAPVSIESQRMEILCLLNQTLHQRATENKTFSSADVSPFSTASSMLNNFLANEIQSKHEKIAAAIEDRNRLHKNDVSTFLAQAGYLTTPRLPTLLPFVKTNSRINDQNLALSRKKFSGRWGIPSSLNIVGRSSFGSIERVQMGLILQNRATIASRKHLLAAIQPPTPSSLLKRTNSHCCTSSTERPLSTQYLDSLRANTCSSKIDGLTGRPAVTVYRPGDDDTLSAYQCFVRKQIEFFEANDKDIVSTAKGRNKPIILGQVGIRCRHCATLPPKYRSRGAMYYPKKMRLIYQAAQSIAGSHLHDGCPNAPEEIKVELANLQKNKSLVGGGKTYWDKAAASVGVHETASCLRFDACTMANSR
jgi:hypothetical protein